MCMHAQKSPFDLVQPLEKRHWDSSLEECVTVTSIQPLVLSFSPLHAPPSPCPLPTLNPIQVNGLTLNQRLPLILPWLFRPPISSQRVLILPPLTSTLIKTDTDRRMWISSAIMCLLRIIAAFSHSNENKRKSLTSSQGQWVTCPFSLSSSGSLLYSKCGTECRNIQLCQS